MKFAEFLSDIEPFENIVESLEYITYKNNFSSKSRPHIRICDVNAVIYKEDEYGVVQGWKPTDLPVLEIACYKDGTEIFYEVQIELLHCQTMPSGEIMVNSRFYCSFRPTDYLGWKSPIAVLHENIDTVARFATYYMKLYGYQYASDAKIGKHCYFTSGNLALAKFDDALTIPESLRKAIFMIKEMDMHSNDDSIILDFFSKSELNSLVFPVCWISYSYGWIDISTEWVFDEDNLDKHMSYHNRESICICHMGDCCYEGLEMRTNDVEFIMKMLTDYLMFLNPGLKTDDVSVSLSFEEAVATMACGFNADYDYNADWRCNFYADGTESTPEQFDKCMEMFKRYKERNNQGENNVWTRHKSKV